MSAQEEFKAHREFIKNPPTVMPGMESEEMSFPGVNPNSSGPSFGPPQGGGLGQSPFGNSPLSSPSMGNSPFNSPSMGSSPFNSPSMGNSPLFGNTAPGSTMGGFPGQQQQQQNNAQWDQTKAELKAGSLKTLTAVGKAAMGSFRTTSKFCYSIMGTHIAILGAVELGLGIVLFLVNVFLPGWCNQFSAFWFSGAVTSLVGLGIWLVFNKSGAEEKARYEESKNSVPVVAPIPAPMSAPTFNSDDSFLGNDSDEESDDDDDDDWDFDLNEDDDKEEEVVETKDPQEVLDSTPTLDKGVYTRQYLYDAYKQVLPKKNPDFTNMNELSEDPDEFEEWGTKVQASAEVAGLDTEKVMLEAVYENLAVYQLKIVRQSGAGAKEKKLVEEVLNAYKVDDIGRDIAERKGAFATSRTAMGYLFITIFKSVPYMVTLGDAYSSCTDWVLDTSVKIPWVFGVSQDGELWKGDLLKIDSLIISGMPRSGKSWDMFSLMLQMCMWMSPEDLTFEVFDVKEGISEYSSFTLPHLKRFESDPQRVVNRIYEIVNVEGDRRKKLLASYGVKKIQDLPADVHLPYLYVVIDEMIGLNQAIEQKSGKEELNRFRDNLNNLISQLPATGIRPLLVPHRIVDKVIPKTSSSLVACRVALKMDTDDGLKGAIDESRAAFGYSLPNAGDAAAKINIMNSGEPFYARSVVATPSDEENIKITKFVQSMWKRILPDAKGWWDDHSLVPKRAVSSESVGKEEPAEEVTPVRGNWVDDTSEAEEAVNPLEDTDTGEDPYSVWDNL